MLTGGQRGQRAVHWALTEGQKFASELGYAPLPKEVVALELEALKRVRQ